MYKLYTLLPLSLTAPSRHQYPSYSLLICFCKYVETLCSARTPLELSHLPICIDMEDDGDARYMDEKLAESIYVFELTTIDARWKKRRHGTAHIISAGSVSLSLRTLHIARACHVNAPRHSGKSSTCIIYHTRIWTSDSVEIITGASARACRHQTHQWKTNEKDHRFHWILIYSA